MEGSALFEKLMLLRGEPIENLYFERSPEWTL